MNINDSLKSLGITESEALDSWEDELATTPEDEVSIFNFSFNITQCLRNVEAVFAQYKCYSN